MISPAGSVKTSASSPESPVEDSKQLATFSIVVAVNRKNNGIGVKGAMPWPSLSHDMKWFKEVTSYVNDDEVKNARVEDVNNLAPQAMIHQLYNSLLHVEEKKDGVSQFGISSSQKMNAVIMGRKTWESIPQKFRPLANRINVVLSSNTELLKDHQQNARVAGSLDKALEMLEQEFKMKGKLGDIFIIGGSQIYNEVLSNQEYSKRVKAIYLTRIGGNFQADCFFPALCLDDGKAQGDYAEQFTMASVSKTYCYKAKEGQQSFSYDFCIMLNSNLLQSQIKSSIKANQPLERVISNLVPSHLFNYHLPHEEQQYLNMVRDVIKNGKKKDDRTGTGTLQQFGRTMRFDLSNNRFPLLTTKDVYWRGVAQQLLWFIRGETNAKTLSAKKVRIWDANGSREFLDNIGLTQREEGDLGPVYGFQWRHFGAQYETMHQDYEGRGVDQIERVLKDIMQNPDSRRIIMSAWNPAAEKKMALPPCHLMAQFTVVNGVLSCQMYQRSADMGLGVPFNIASYSLLTRLFAHVTGLKAGEFIHVIGDCHVYSNHVEPLQEQLKRTPRAFPMLDILKPFERKTTADGKCDIKHILKYLEGLTLADLKVIDYLPMKKIAMKMAV